MITKCRLFLSILFVLSPYLPCFSQSQLRTPYPIIFVHGWTGSNLSWHDENYDIVDFLTSSSMNQPLTYGGVLNVTLDYDRSESSLMNTVEQDVHLFTANPNFGDIYIANFDVHASGIVPHEIPNWLGLGTCYITDLIVTEEETEIGVTVPAKFFIGDIIRVSYEFMKVIGINESSINVVRHIINSDPSIHFLGDAIWDVSTESNQSAVMKQGYGLNKIVDKVKEETGSSKVILVGHSMGGLAIREFIRNYFDNDVAKVVTIGTPHYGSNLTDLPETIFNSIKGMDPRSDAVRDLRTGFDSDLGVYLFGGYESSIFNHFYCKDVNCNLSQNDIIQGLNQNYQHLGDIARTWIASKVWDGLPYLLGPNDEIVLTQSQYINSDDTIMTHTGHLNEPDDIYALIRGLDEPHDPDLAYQINPNSTNNGFITYRRNMNPTDFDLFKVSFGSKSVFNISLLGNQLSGVELIELLDENLSPIQITTNINEQLSETLPAGNYFVRISGTATNVSYQYPYTLITSSAEVPAANLSASPDDLLQFFDVVVNENRDKTVNLTNNSTVPITITNIEIAGQNASHYAIMSPLSFVIQPMGQSDVSIRFEPTDLGIKNTNLIISNNSPEVPEIDITLSGQGVESATKTLVMIPDSLYNYGNTLINSTTKNKIFNLQNTGSNVLTVEDLSITGSNADQFTIIEQPQVPFYIETGEVKQVKINFSPTSIGSKNSLFNIANNSYNSSPVHSMDLYGNGVNSIYNGYNKKIIAYEYWFDDNYSSRVHASIFPRQIYNLNTSLPTTGLNSGLHKFNIRFMDENKVWSSIISQFFYKQPLSSLGGAELIAYEYWFDNDYGSKVYETVQATEVHHLVSGIAANSLPQGLHAFHLRYKDNTGKWSSVVSQFFYKQPVTGGAEKKIVGYEYWFDSDYAGKVDINVSPTTVHQLNEGLDAIQLPQGLHTFHIRYRDSGGLWSSVVSQFFYKAPVTNNLPNLVSAYRYWFDLSDSNMVTTHLAVPVNPLQLMTNINTCGMSLGVHTVHFQFEDLRGFWSSVVTDTFNIPPITAPTITPDGPTTFCVGDSVILTSSLAADYKWNTGAITRSITVKTAGEYFVKAFYGCGDSLTSDPVTTTLEPPTIPGYVSGGSTIDFGLSTDTLKLYGYTGSVLGWQKRLDGGSFMSIPNTTGYINYLEIPDTTGAWDYRAEVRRNDCPVLYSDPTTVNVLPVTRTINMKLLLEGLYDPATGQMNKAQDENGDKFPGTIADRIRVKVVKPVSPYSIFYVVNDIDMNQDGTCTFTVPRTGFYYLVIKHRNSIETWSAEPIDALPEPVFYDFSADASKAFGYNMKDVGGKWAIWGGDVNQDGIVDAGDMNPVDNASTAITFGYVSEDVNGDGIVDAGDLNLVDNNSTTIIMAIIP